MAKHEVEIHDGATVDDEVAAGDEPLGPPRSAYTVVNPLFKNGRSYEPGETVELDERTAANFLAAGDIE